MKIIKSTDELKAVTGPDGRVTEPVQLVEDGHYYGLSFLTSFENVRLNVGCALRGLEGVTSLDGVVMARECRLWGLENLVSLNGLVMAEECFLVGLKGVTSLDGVVMARECVLSDLKGVTSLDGVVMARECRLWGLENLTDWGVGTMFPKGVTMWDVPQRMIDQLPSYVRNRVDFRRIS